MPTAVGRRLTEVHRLAQGRIAAETADLLLPQWRTLDLGDLNSTVGPWAAACAALIAQQRQVSIRTAAAYLDAFRAVELGAKVPPFTLPAPPPFNQAATVTSLLVTGPWALKSKIGAGMPYATAVEQALAGSTSAGIRHAINGSRELVLAARDADPRAQGYVRVTSGTACAFCEDIAAVSADNPALSGEFECHDGCNCHPELAYG